MQTQMPATLEFIGTATVLVRFAGFTILTDPNFLHAGDHVHLGYGLRARRLTNPSRELDTIPPVDFVVLSHMHEDHFDRDVAKRLDRRIPIYSTPKAAGTLRALGFRFVRGLRRWESVRLEKAGGAVDIRAMPGVHGPGPLAAALPPVMGTLLDFITAAGERLRLYISGDTLVHSHLKEIPKRFPGIDVALVHLGGTKVLGLTVTMDAAQGVRFVQIIAPKVAVPIHYDDYDRFKSPLADFVSAIEAAGLSSSVRYLGRGESMELAGRRPEL